jgi:sulfatase modifying factor 1
VNAPTGGANRVGSEPYGDGKWGHADLGGNVYEWILDGYQDPYATDACEDCAELTATGDRGFRSGHFAYREWLLRTAFRGFDVPSSRCFVVGVRCARTP